MNRGVTRLDNIFRDIAHKHKKIVDNPESGDSLHQQIHAGGNVIKYTRQTIAPPSSGIEETLSITDRNRTILSFMMIPLDGRSTSSATITLFYDAREEVPAMLAARGEEYANIAEKLTHAERTEDSAYVSAEFTAGELPPFQDLIGCLFRL